jgi:uncharacterized membrane protein YbaN (DUF454 family)
VSCRATRRADAAPGGAASIAPVLAALGLIVPLGLAGAVSPVMLTEQTVLLAGTDGRRAAPRYAAGALLVLLVVISAVVWFGHAIALPTEPKLDATLDILLGAGLIAVAALVGIVGRELAGRRPRRHAAEPSAYAARAAFPFGVFSMATNFTTLALMVPAAKEIATDGAGFAERVVLVLVLVALAGLPAWLPVALSAVLPDRGERAFAAIGDLLERHGRSAVIGLLAAGGLFLVARGIVRLA